MTIIAWIALGWAGLCLVGVVARSFAKPLGTHAEQIAENHMALQGFIVLLLGGKVLGWW